jgi:hypothetical protein
MTRKLLQGMALAGLMASAAWLPALAQDAGNLGKEEADLAHKRPPVYSPYADRNFPTRPFFGDTHLHTSYSMDAGAFGARIDPRGAYRFARGEQITSSTGQPVKLSRPLDFLVVAVDEANATWTNTTGSPELIAIWMDPGFDPTESAFYHGRVIEIPTPRWTAYDAKRFGVESLPGTATTITERAYTSPIWYTPGT